ncbi:MAG TPA: ester cyclase [Chitinophagaceae bacterium]|nr:ester cyclase [Chitinophagaceae bacterium]
MNKLITIASAGLTLVFISCNSSGGGGTQGEKNMETVKTVDRAIESGDMSKLDQYITADAVDHAGEHGEVKGLDSIKANLGRMHDEYKDLKVEELQQASNGDYVFTLSRFQGTNTVPSMGAPAGTHFDMTSVEVVKFNSDGKATEHWGYVSMADAMKMAGGGNMEMMPGGSKMDTSKMKMDTMKH